MPTSPRPRRRAPWPRWVPAVFFVLTFLTTSLAGVFFTEDPEAVLPLLEALFQRGEMGVMPALVVHGLPFSLTLMGFFLAHEMGHYLACRYYGIQSTLPYFIPFPPALVAFSIGTLGAVIRIRSPFPHRRALFDVGIAGPIAGLFVALPALVWGLLDATPVAAAPLTPGTYLFGDSLLTLLLQRLLLPGAEEVSVGAVFVAGWIGMLATAMNLFPAGQLDGGHVVYALAPRWHRAVSLSTGLFLVALVATTFVAHGSFSVWLLWALIVLMLCRRHPPLPRSGGALGPVRVGLALAMAIVLALIFMPHPLVFVG